jgi:cell division protein YceG involved in septum cleavage
MGLPGRRKMVDFVSELRAGERSRKAINLREGMWVETARIKINLRSRMETQCSGNFLKCMKSIVK